MGSSPIIVPLNIKKETEKQSLFFILQKNITHLFRFFVFIIFVKNPALKNILSILLLLIAFGTSAQIVNIPDNTLKTALLNNSAINTNNDAHIQLSEAIAFTDTMDLTGIPIYYLTGIEAFVNIKGLIIESGAMASSFTSNTALKYLKLSGNTQTVDVTQNNALEYLDISNSTFSTIDITQNTALKYFDCSSSQIGNTNFSQNLALEHLILTNNVVMGTLNLANNTQLDTLDGRFNALSTVILPANSTLRFVDLSFNALSNINTSTSILLETLKISGYGITNFDFSQNLALKHLECELNPLDSLDLSANVNLETLVCNGTTSGPSPQTLSYLNLANGNNVNMTQIFAQQNPDLLCIQVDNPTYSNANWTGANFNFDPNSSFGISCGAIALQLDIFNFDVALSSELNANLHWSTTSYQNEATFIIERSTNISKWDHIGEINNYQFVARENTLSFTDQNVQNGQNYYRIKAIDPNGNETYSKTKSINRQETNPIFTIYPNPASNELIVASNNKKIGQLKILTPMGHTVYSMLNCDVNNSEIKIDISDLPNGLYFIQVNKLTYRFSKN